MTTNVTYLADQEAAERDEETMLQLVWRQFRKHKMAVLGMTVLLLLIVGVVVGPIVTPYDIERSSLRERYQPPSLVHPFGTDDLGRDMLTRILAGGRISLNIGFMSMVVALAIGVTVGSVAGFYGGKVDNILMRFTDIMLTLPRLFLLIIMVLLLRGINWPYLQESGGIVAIILVLGVLSWMSIARLVRGAFLSLRQMEFVEAARSLGLSNRRIIVRHILPNAVTPVIVAATLGMARAIISESGLSFLGFGVQPPTPTWGNMLSNAQQEMLRGHMWMAIFPGLMIFITVIAINYIGDGLRDALDPRHVG
ncbi:MAG: ABC transporter permease [Ardenticatenaceae bacterium]|nr:ABC transporter permease [Ardenticatenaceae bacterium]